MGVVQEERRIVYGQASKKPVTIEYFEFERTTTKDDIQKWLSKFDKKFEDHFISEPSSGFTPSIKVKTLEGTSYDVTENHMIVKGVKDEFYPCAKDIFLETYDIVS